MRYFDENRRRLMKKSFVRGLPKTVSSDFNQVQIVDSAGVPINSFRIVGSSVQDGIPTPDHPVSIRNTNDEGMRITVYNEEFREEVSVPTEARPSTIIPLKLGEYSTITADRINNKVIMSRGSQFVNTSPQSYIYAQSHSSGRTLFRLSLGYTIIGALCTHFPVEELTDENVSSNVNRCFIIPNDRYAYISLEGITTVDDFKSWLQTEIDKGTPLQILIFMVSPVVQEIQDSDVGRQLMNVRTPLGQNAIFSVEDNLPPTSIHVSYYSLEQQDEITLTVNFVDYLGVYIHPSKSYAVRKNSRYRITPLNIEGYKPSIPYYEGFAAEDTEITLTYNREE